MHVRTKKAGHCHIDPVGKGPNPPLLPIPNLGQTTRSFDNNRGRLPCERGLTFSVPEPIDRGRAYPETG